MVVAASHYVHLSTVSSPCGGSRRSAAKMPELFREENVINIAVLQLLLLGCQATNIVMTAGKTFFLNLGKDRLYKYRHFKNNSFCPSTKYASSLSIDPRIFKSEQIDQENIRFRLF